MNRRSLFGIVTIFVLLACRLFTPGPPLAPATATPFRTNAPVVQSTVTSLVTETFDPLISTDWLSWLEVIQSANWSRLQLLETLPAEMPLNHSAVAISPDGKTAAIGSSSGASILFIDLPSRQPTWVEVKDVENVDAYFERLEYLSDGSLLANADGPYMIYHIDTAGNVLSSWYGINFALSVDRRTMIYDGEEGITLLEIASNTPLVTLPGESGFDFSLSPDASLIAVEDIGVDYIRTTIWDVPSQVSLATFEETAAPRFSPDGKFLAAIRYEYETDRVPVKIFSPDGATEIASLDISGPNSLINRPPVWSIDGSVLVAQVTDGSSIAWDATSWQPLESPVLQGLVDSFSPDGRILITRADDGAILLWGVAP